MREAYDRYAAVSETWARGLLENIPGHMVPGVVNWVLEGKVPGGFLQAVINNDLMGALGKADDTNKHKLWNYGMFFHNFAPSGCYGSPDKVQAWIDKGGLLGGANQAPGATDV